MNFILNNIFPGFKIGNKLVFPSGDMFWAKVHAIHQIFNIKFIKKFPKELNQTNEIYAWYRKNLALFSKIKWLFL